MAATYFSAHAVCALFLSLSLSFLLRCWAECSWVKRSHFQPIPSRRTFCPACYRRLTQQANRGPDQTISFSPNNHDGIPRRYGTINHTMVHPWASTGDGSCSPKR
ncbi:hypothetical protein LY78DRAFT_650278 [Colletotrichum sublineola]|nr:hypothetical protein LY78DRAFT_650278 [Colletotrichum sublineola]